MTINSSPTSGSPVTSGDTILLDTIAQERRRNGPWQTGIQIFQLIGPDGVIGDPIANSPPPKPCGQKDWSEAIQTEYTVPDDAPAEFQICGIAEDYVGNGADRLQGCATYYTGEVWKGTMVEDFAPGGGQVVAKGTLDLVVDADGAVTGTGSLTFTRCLAPNCQLVGHTDRVTFSGTRDAGSFHLTISGPGGSVSLDVR